MEAEAQLRGWLARYGDHHYKCVNKGEFPELGCSCGWQKVIDEVHRRDAEELARINDAYPGRKPK